MPQILTGSNLVLMGRKLFTFVKPGKGRMGRGKQRTASACEKWDFLFEETWAFTSWVMRFINLNAAPLSVNRVSSSFPEVGAEVD